MIPTKMLVYRGPDGGTRSEVSLNTRRRKKSCADLFQNGYRVKMAHGGAGGEKEEPDPGQRSLASCLRFVSHWGKEGGS